MRSLSTAATKVLGSARTDFATLGVALAIYGCWIAATLLHGHIHPAALMAVGGWLVGWHGSLQHETIHGHPTPWPWVNRALAFAPLNLWLPYDRYRQTHLAHHSTERLTEPGFDPESRYTAPGGGWTGAWRRGVARINATLAGRLLLGPLIEVATFLTAELRACLVGQPDVRRAWAAHLVGVAGLVIWLHWVCHLSLAQYVVSFVYPGCALSLLRSFAEHRADPIAARRIAVVEKAPILGLLFLNNNLHAVHHAFPQAPWRRLPRLYAEHRSSLLDENGGLAYSGYGEVFRRYWLSPHDVVVHPVYAAEPAGAAS